MSLAKRIRTPQFEAQVARARKRLDKEDGLMKRLVTDHHVRILQKQGSNAMVECDRCGQRTLAAWKNITPDHEGLDCYGNCGRSYATTTKGELEVYER